MLTEQSGSHIITASLNTLEFSQAPENWKCELICPIHKNGSISDPLNYIPNALTFVIGKHIEHVINCQTT